METCSCISRSVGPVEVMLLEKESSKAAAASLEKAQAFLQGSLYGERHNRAPGIVYHKSAIIEHIDRSSASENCTKSR